MTNPQVLPAALIEAIQHAAYLAERNPNEPVRVFRRQPQSTAGSYTVRQAGDRVPEGAELAFEVVRHPPRKHPDVPWSLDSAVDYVLDNQPPGTALHPRALLQPMPGSTQPFALHFFSDAGRCVATWNPRHNQKPQLLTGPDGLGAIDRAVFGQMVFVDGQIVGPQHDISQHIAAYARQDDGAPSVDRMDQQERER